MSELANQVDPETPGSGASVDPAQNPENPQVDPATPPATPTKSEREAELERLLDEERGRSDAHRKDAEKKRREKLEAQKRNGEFESLYTESEKERQDAARELDTVKGQVATLTAERDNYKSQVDGLKKSYIERFEEGDRPLAESTPLDKIPALYERLYPGTQLTQAPASVGATKTIRTAPQGNWRDLSPSEQIAYGLRNNK